MNGGNILVLKKVLGQLVSMILWNTHISALRT